MKFIIPKEEINLTLYPINPPLNLKEKYAGEKWKEILPPELKSKPNYNIGGGWSK
jgi:hypothetical protein